MIITLTRVNLKERLIAYRKTIHGIVKNRMLYRVTNKIIRLNLSIARRSENSHPLFYHQINDVVDGMNFQHLSELTYRTNDSMISRHTSHKFIFFLFMHVVLKLNRLIFHARVRAFVDTRYKIEYNYPGSSISTIVQKPFPSSTKAPQS